MWSQIRNCTCTSIRCTVLVIVLSVVRTGLLPPLTSTPPMVNTGPAALQSATIMTKVDVTVGCCSIERVSLHRSNHLVASCYNYNEATGLARYPS